MLYDDKSDVIEVTINSEKITVPVANIYYDEFCIALNKELSTFYPYKDGRIVLLTEGYIQIYYDINSLFEREHKAFKCRFYKVVGNFA